MLLFITLLQFTCICIATCTTQADDIVTFPATSVCNETVLLGEHHHAAVIDFRYSAFARDSDRHVCSFHVQTTDTPYVGMKFLSTFHNGHHSNLSQCSFELNIAGKSLNQTHYNSFPVTEISVDIYGYITIETMLINCNIDTDDTILFELLVFRFGDKFCFGEEIKCVNSTRCVSEQLACSEVYDFCNNGRKNCKGGSENDCTYTRHKRKPPVSVSGIVLGTVCLTVVVIFLLYVIVCRKRPCFQRFTQKLTCRSPLCPGLGHRGNDRIPTRALFTNETEAVTVSIDYYRFREPPPNYSDIYTNSVNYTQIESGNAISQAGGDFLSTPNGAQNIPPPCYSHYPTENVNITPGDQNELPPPYSQAVASGSVTQHI